MSFGTHRSIDAAPAKGAGNSQHPLSLHGKIAEPGKSSPAEGEGKAVGVAEIHENTSRSMIIHSIPYERTDCKGFLAKESTHRIKELAYLIEWYG